MTVRLWVVLVIAAAAGLLVTLTGYTAVHYAGVANDRQATLRAADKLRTDTRAAYRLSHVAVPSFRSVTTYPAPYNISIVCTVRGSSAAGDTRVPLDPQAAPAVGDVYVKTCVALAPSEAPSG